MGARQYRGLWRQSPRGHGGRGIGGGKNVGTLLGLPAADGLYARAMVFSGGAQTINLPGDAQTFAEAVTRRLGGRERLLVAPFPPSSPRRPPCAGPGRAGCRSAPRSTGASCRWFRCSASRVDRRRACRC
jgi:hypothetical protein